MARSYHLILLLVKLLMLKRERDLTGGEKLIYRIKSRSNKIFSSC